MMVAGSRQVAPSFEIPILGAPGVDLEPIRGTLKNAPTLSGGKPRLLPDPRGVLEVQPPAVVVAALSTRFSEIFEDLIGLRYAGHPWVAVAPSSIVDQIRGICFAAGAAAVIDQETMEQNLPPLIEAVYRDGTDPGNGAPGPSFIAMLTHVLGMTVCLEIEGSHGQTAELTVNEGIPWGCRTPDGRRGPRVAREALGWSSARVGVAAVKDPGPRNLFVSWPELLQSTSQLATESTAITIAEPKPEESGTRSSTGSPSGVPPKPSVSQWWTEEMASQLDLSALSSMDGFIGACLVDSESGMMLGQEGGGSRLNLEVAAAGNTEVVRAKRKTMKSLDLDDSIEDILITLGGQYHLIRPLAKRDTLFLYIALDRKNANLAMARFELRDFEAKMKF